MRGYFGIGVENISKSRNLGALMRTAHAFGASFVFSVGADESASLIEQSDTSRSERHVPYYRWERIEDMSLPRNSTLVGIELCEQSIDLPSFRHPLSAVYVLGPEKGSLSAEMQERCASIVKIPTKFCINLSLAGALVLYDRLLSGSYPPVRGGGR